MCCFKWNVLLGKVAGDQYRPFFAYDVKDASMEYPDNVSAQDLTKLYLLALGMEMNDCIEPCKTTFVQSSLRKVN